MIELTILLILALVVLAAALFLLGFWLGDYQKSSPLTQVRLEATEARRQMHDVDQEAFVAMVEHIFRKEAKEAPERVDGPEVS